MPPPRLKRSNTAGQVPASLADGEIAINQADGKLFYQTTAGGVSTLVATPADGSVTTAKIANGAVTYAKVQNVSATDRLLGRSTAGAGVVEEIPCTAFGRSLINDAHAAEARTTLGLGTAFDGAAGTVSAPTFTFTSDTNTGVYSPGADQWAVSTGGVQRLSISAAGDVGVGVAAVANVRLYSHQTVTNVAGAVCHQVIADPVSTVDGAYAAAGATCQMRTDVATGVTDTGPKRGINAFALRNHKSASGTDAGALTYLRGAEIAYGHSSINAALTPTTTQVVGLYLQPYAGPGTVTEMYDLFIGTDAVGTGTVTNRYAIFQQSTTARNYFAGNVGIGTTNPTAKLAIVGTVANDGIIVAGPSFRALQIRPNSGSGANNGIVQADDSSIIYSAGGSNTGSFCIAPWASGTSGIRMTSAGLVGIGKVTPATALDVSGVITATPTAGTAGVDINGDMLRVRTARTPASATATGNTGEICWDANYVYVCTATNTWRRSAISSW